jgi:hypothetical protein
MVNGARITEAQLWHHGSRDDGDLRHGDDIHTRWHRSGGGVVTEEAIRQGGDIGGRGEEAGTAAAGQRGRRASSTSRSWPAPAVCFRVTTTVRQMQHLDDGGGGSTG